MAVTIDQSPSRILLSKNPIVFELSTDNYVTTEGVKAKRRIDFTATTPLDGDTIAISAPGFADDDIPAPNIVFTFRNSPDDSGTEIPTGVVNDLNWIQQLADYMAQNPTFNLHYEAYCDSFPALTILAREASANWEPTFIFGFTGADPTFNLNITGVDPVLEDDFQVRARVILDKGFGNIITGEWEYKTPDQDGSLSWDFSRTVDALFPVDWLSKYTLADSIAMITGSNVGQAFMRVEFSEYYGTYPISNAIKTSGGFTVLKGGFKSYDKSSTVLEATADENKFLTWRPYKNYVFEGARDWLHFINDDPGKTRTSLKTRVEIYNEEGDPVLFDGLSTKNLTYTNLYEEGVVFSVPCGYRQMNLHILNGANTAYKYKMAIFDNSNALICGPVEFWLKKPSVRELNLIYYNSFGLEEAFCFEGERSMVVSSTFDRLKLPENSDPQTDDFTDLDFNHLTTERLTVSTGPLLKENARALQEILTSPKLFIVLEQDGSKKRYAVRIEETELRTAIKDFQATNSLPETITLVFNEERAFSNINKLWQ